MDIFGILSLIGGLAFFLYGIQLMGSSIEKVSGGRLERLLEKPASSPVRAALLGAGVAGLLQSSAATTVMVVGFVNSGIMKLTQAAGIIIGANVGTTVTAWILSLSSLEGESLLVQIFKPSTLSPASQRGSASHWQQKAAGAPSLVLRCLGKQETAWDLAKRYNTTIGVILAANQLEAEGDISRDQLLLIPRKRA